VVVVLVNWLIRPGYEERFVEKWRTMTVDAHSGLYREILTNLDKGERAAQLDSKFHTFSVGDPFYSTYINIGMWESLESFDKAIGKYIPNAIIEDKEGSRVQTVELEEFEFKLRERVVLQVVGTRGGRLPIATVT
jgi:hypothetical protein